MARFALLALISSLNRRYCPYALILIVYVLATWFTDAFYMGDTWIYVSDLLKARSLGASFQDFGHALWLPFGWLVSRAVHSLGLLAVGTDARQDVTLTLLRINWVAGLLSVLLVHSLARQFCTRKIAAYLVTGAFLFSNAFLNYAQTGQPYVPGLALVLLGLRLLLKEDRAPRQPGRTAILAGAALAGGLCLWVAFVLSTPALLLSPLFLIGLDKSRLRLTLQTALVSGLLVTLVYASIFVNLGIHDLAGLQAWIASSTHGVSPDAPLKAVQRMVFALARNFVNMGDDGRLFKRYLVHDPFNPVSLSELFRISLWKLLLFYLFSLLAVLNLFASGRGRRTLALLVVNALPVLIFALFLFESGSIDRYLPLFPLLFLSLSVSLGSDPPARATLLIALVFVAVVAVSTTSAMSTTALDRQQEAVAARIRDLGPLLKPGSRVVTVTQQDEVYAFNQTFPFNPINRAGHLDADILVDPGTTQIARWRRIFAAKTLSLWDRGGDVWITRRVFHPRPRSDWNWVEGDDPRISWTDIYAFFSRLETGQAAGGEDGFVLVPPSPRNEQLLSDVVRKSS